jgi:hypothetical protein
MEKTEANHTTPKPPTHHYRSDLDSARPTATAPPAKTSVREPVHHQFKWWDERPDAERQHWALDPFVAAGPPAFRDRPRWASPSGFRHSRAAEVVIRSTGLRSAMTGMIDCPTHTPSVVVAHHHRRVVQQH